MKLWNKGYTIENAVEKFTVGNDRVLDLDIAEWDVRASIAQAKMLAKIGICTPDEGQKLVAALVELLKSIEIGSFTIEEDFEDVHSKIEYELTQKLGDLGKKIHTGRSRNDQVLVALHLFIKYQVEQFKQKTSLLFDRLQALSEQYKDVLIPGYTHMQVAMPSSVGLWLGGHAELLVDDIYLFNAAKMVADQNPLGSGAGYGSSIPLDREMTTKELGLASLKVNATAAMMSRGKLEKSMAFSMASLAGTLAKLAMDITFYMNENHQFISFPKELTTGSSIMPHKKNPDVFELVRAKCNKIQALPNELTMITNNLPSGYHRDYQLLKDSLFPAIKMLEDCLEISVFMLEHLEVLPSVLNDPTYDLLFSVENVNELVSQGIPFRDAYRTVGDAIEKADFIPKRKLDHQHIGSIGHLSNDLIRAKFEKAMIN